MIHPRTIEFSFSLSATSFVRITIEGGWPDVEDAGMLREWLDLVARSVVRISEDERRATRGTR